MAKVTVKEKIWKELRKTSEGTVIDMLALSKDVGCSLAYINSISRFALEVGFFKFDENGAYVIIKIPKKYEEFQTKINAKYNTYRQGTSSYGKSAARRRPRVPKEFVLDESTLLAVIKKVIEDKKEVESKLKKVVAFAKRVKVERDELLKTLEKSV